MQAVDGGPLNIADVHGDQEGAISATPLWPVSAGDYTSQCTPSGRLDGMQSRQC
jgi:hypothetical protein